MTYDRSVVTSRLVDQAGDIDYPEHDAAAKLGAARVVGVDIDYEVLGQANNMLMVTVSGTAVVCE